MPIQQPYAPDWSFALDVACQQRDDAELYDIIRYLENGSVPPDEDRQAFIQKCQNYYIDQDTTMLMHLHYLGSSRKRGDAFH